MKVGILIQPKLKRDYGPKGPVRVYYNTDPYQLAYGAIRAFQRFVAIALTSVGTDSLRPWLGTALPQLPKYNIHVLEEMKLFVRDELQKAIQQFFMLQSQEIETYADEDIINSIDIVSIDINELNRISATIRFTPKNSQAILLSLEV
jgi:hypothetical protein